MPHTALKNWFSRYPRIKPQQELCNPLGIIAGNSNFPLVLAKEAKNNRRDTVVVAHRGETWSQISEHVSALEWIRVGELGKIIETFKSYNVKEVAFAGGINRIRLFGGVKLDARGLALLKRLKSAKDDVIMRGIAEELESEGIRVISCATYLQDCLMREGVITSVNPSEEDVQDISVGVAALKAMSSQDIGQLVVVKEGVIVAVEAVEGSDRAILRGGELAGPGAVIVKFAKTTQDLRFDLPTIGRRTIESMLKAEARVLAVEAGKTLLINETEVVELANKHGIVVLGLKSENEK